MVLQLRALAERRVLYSCRILTRMQISAASQRGRQTAACPAN